VPPVLPPQAEPQADHRATRIHEHGGPAEIRIEQIVGLHSLGGCIVERVQEIGEQLEER
jgi:hypothetical protein